MFVCKNKKIIASLIFFCLSIVFTLAMMAGGQRGTGAEQEQSSNKLMLSSANSLAFTKELHEKAEISIDSKEEYKDGTDQRLFLPRIDDVREQGYQKNENGETYGPDVKELDNGPELVLVRYGDGYGYIRQSEMDNDGVESPQNAAEKTSEEGSRKINVYLQDGTTCIGTFELKG